jgi:adenine-specific DNA-methyltransferase
MKAPLSLQKIRGGYYTPRAISDFLACWAVQRATDSVLEPSCGDGAIIESVMRRRETFGSDWSTGETIGLELNPEAAREAAARLNASNGVGEIIVGDFFAYCRDRLLPGGLWDSLAPRFDAVIGNPPFIRYQNFPDEHRETAFDLMRQIGLHPNKLTNAWVAFLICSAMALKKDGRLAMVIPAELLQVSYAAEVRRFLSDFFERITLVTFRNLVFPDIQQEVVLLLAEKQASESLGIRTVELREASDLSQFDFFESLNAGVKPLDHSAEKWTKYFLPARQIVLLRNLRAHSSVSCIREVAEVDVGVVTGENDFFILKPSEARGLAITRFTKRTVSRSAQLLGLTLGEADWLRLREEDSRILLFAPKNTASAELPKAVRAYIKTGEKKETHKGYKCRIRKQWYVVPSTWIPDAFAMRQVHRFPKLVVNDAKATSTDTVHRVRFRTGTNPRQIAAAFLNSMTFAFSEVMGRSYGGGVLTFEPSEVEGLPIPLIGAERLDYEFIDRALRSGDIISILDHTDQILLRDGMGLSQTQIGALRDAWTSLRDRRINRRASAQQLSFSSSLVDVATIPSPVFDESVEAAV